jgi:Xaa-Pro aminopeptidase
MSTSDKLQALRDQMHTQQIDAYIIPTNDPHQSEYLADYWKARTWLSGFSGSAGTIIVTQNHAGLWTDSRYFIQAEQELKGTPIELHPQKVPHAPEHITWLMDTLPAGATVGVDGWLISAGHRNFLRNQLAKGSLELKTNVDLITSIWVDRPPLPQSSIFALDTTYTGLSRTQKLQSLREDLKTIGANSFLISTLDDIAWTLNLRGSDVECNPVFLSYLFIGPSKTILFVDQKKLAGDLVEQLQADGISFQDYEKVASFVGNLPASTKILIPKSNTNWALYQRVNPEQVVVGPNFCEKRKAIKNETEIGYLREAMHKDGVALTRLFRWLDRQLERGTVSEAQIAKQLAAFRKEQGQYFGESFNAIVGYQGNGAIVHYRPIEGQCAEVKKGGILLLDSGGQYMEGTTDITRTIALSPPTEEQKRCYTYVLKGHIELATIQFPEGTTGVQLDTLARMHLWKAGLNYGHGTGHGVGFFLNVHEGPQGFTANPRNSRGTTAFEPGMYTSNEPGYYKTDEYGIRIENLVICRKAETEGFLYFETITLFPIDTTLIDITLLTAAEKDWLNEYHAKVFNELKPLLNEEERTWMKAKCQPIP